MGAIASRHGDIVEITLDWPNQRNALGPDEGRELRLALEAANADESVCALVLSANGKAFCAGGNLPEIVRLAAISAETVRTTVYGEFQGIFRAITQSPVPVIAAVDGPAIGFGCDLAIAGNATFLGSRGWLAQGWAKAGLIPATGGTLFARRRGGAQAVWRLLASERLDGPAAEAMGLGIACENAREAALAMAHKFSQLPRAPLRALVALSRIEELQPHLNAALGYQVDFIMNPNFAAFAQKLLSR